MNVGAFLRVLHDINAEYEDLDIGSGLTRLETTLSASTSQPNPSTAEAFAQEWEHLRQALATAPSNELIPSRLRILEEIDGVDRVGTGLAVRIQEVLDDGRVTPATALAAITEVRKDVEKFFSDVAQAEVRLTALGLKADRLDEGQAQVGLLIPRVLVGSDVSNFTKELKLLHRHLATLAEVVEGEATPFAIYQLSTSDFGVFLSATPRIAEIVSLVVSKIVTLYKDILEIRKARAELGTLKAPDKALKPLEKWEDEQRIARLEELGAEILKEYRGKDQGRGNELATGLNQALLFLADRIDRGLDVEATIEVSQTDEAVTADSDEGEAGLNVDAESVNRRTLALKIRSRTTALAKLERSSEPVLRLTAGEREKFEGDPPEGKK